MQGFVFFIFCYIFMLQWHVLLVQDVKKPWVFNKPRPTLESFSNGFALFRARNMIFLDRLTIRLRGGISKELPNENDTETLSYMYETEADLHEPVCAEHFVFEFSLRIYLKMCPNGRI